MHRSTSSNAASGATTPPLLPAVVAAVVACVGVAAVIGSRALGYWVELGPGPGFFPFWLGIILTALGLLWLALELRNRRAAHIGESSSAAEPSREDEAPAYALPTVIAIVVSLCVLAALLEVLGYQLSMLLFLLFHLLVIGRRGVLLSATLALAGSLGVFVVFTRLLTVPLPASSIPLLRELGL